MAEPFLTLSGTIPVAWKNPLSCEWSLKAAPASSRKSIGFVNSAVSIKKYVLDKNEIQV